MGAALFRGGRLLILKRARALRAFPGTWDIPGGHVEYGEELGSALRREVREETGLEVAVGEPFHAGFFDYPGGLGRRVRTVEIDYLCRAKGGANPVLNPREHTAFAWIRTYDARTHPAPPMLRQILRAALARR